MTICFATVRDGRRTVRCQWHGQNRHHAAGPGWLRVWGNLDDEAANATGNARIDASSDPRLVDELIDQGMTLDEALAAVDGPRAPATNVTAAELRATAEEIA